MNRFDGKKVLSNLLETNIIRTKDYKLNIKLIKSGKISIRMDTRKVIKEPGSTPNKDVYYIPGYLRIKCKNFT